MKKVKDVVRISGLSKRTLQYYDEIGLLKVKRTALNYRVYTEDDLDTLWKILIYKELDLNLNEIKELLQEEKMERLERLEEILKKQKELIREMERKNDFLKKIIENGVPDRKTVCKGNEGKTYRKLVMILAERF